MANIHKAVLVVGFSLLFALAGCGQTGPLYLPEEDKKSEQTP